MTELRSLTIARGAAAWLVVLYHIRGSIAGLPAPVTAVLAKGYLAVDFFFLLSGFVIWLSWHARFRNAGFAAIPRFLQKRIARIWPLHVAMLAVTAALALLLAATGRHDPAFPVDELPLHLLLVQNWGLTDTLRWNDPAWSISCELAAYLLFPLIAIAVDWRRLTKPAAVSIIAALLIGLHSIMRDQPDLGSDIARFGLARCLVEFTAGTILAALWLRARSAWPAMIAAAALLVVWAAGAPETLAVPGALAAMLLALAICSRPSGGAGSVGGIDRKLAMRVLHHLGEISYATYLSHFLLWKAFKLVVVTNPADVPPAQIALYLALVLIASAALYRCVERPAQRWINRMPIRRFPPRAPRRAQQ
jgi:peptidoglycan/LPS O-acetylase OafA/YrhL